MKQEFVFMIGATFEVSTGEHCDVAHIYTDTDALPQLPRDTLDYKVRLRGISDARWASVETLQARAHLPLVQLVKRGFRGRAEIASGLRWLVTESGYDGQRGI
jgi:hypothetical protein